MRLSQAQERALLAACDGRLCMCGRDIWVDGNTMEVTLATIDWLEYTSPRARQPRDSGPRYEPSEAVDLARLLPEGSAMARAPTKCAVCPADAVNRNRCAEHQLKAWRNRSQSSMALAGNREHRHARAAAMRRTGARCEECGEKDPDLNLHHPEPISRGGEIVQADARLLCPSCHLAADHVAGVRHGGERSL